KGDVRRPVDITRSRDRLRGPGRGLRKNRLLPLPVHPVFRRMNGDSPPGGEQIVGIALFCQSRVMNAWKSFLHRNSLTYLRLSGKRSSLSLFRPGTETQRFVGSI